MLVDVQGAGSILAKFAIPTIAIARHPAVETVRDKVNARQEEQPGD
jgi:hypothetical protein